MRLQHPGSLLQYLMVCFPSFENVLIPYPHPRTPQMCFIPDNSTRRHLVPPTQINVDFRAACFCHKRIVDIGFVCSICLSSQCPISSFLKGDAAIAQRHRYYFQELAQQEKNREDGQRGETSDPKKDEDSLGSYGRLVGDANPNTTFLIDWWLEGLRPGDFDNQQKEVDSFKGAKKP